MCTIEGNTSTITTTGTNPHVLPLLVVPIYFLPSDFTGTVAGNRHYSTRTIQGSSYYCGRYVPMPWSLQLFILLLLQNGPPSCQRTCRANLRIESGCSIYYRSLILCRECPGRLVLVLMLRSLRFCDYVFSSEDPKGKHIFINIIGIIFAIRHCNFQQTVRGGMNCVSYDIPGMRVPPLVCALSLGYPSTPEC